jgi:hypothetical protein
VNRISASGFAQAVEAYGWPLRLRADMCFEAMQIGQAMIDRRGAGAYLAGPSTANQVSKEIVGTSSCSKTSLNPVYDLAAFVWQRIENYWNFMWSHYASWIKQLFQSLEQQGQLDRCVFAGDVRLCFAVFWS